MGKPVRYVMFAGFTRSVTVLGTVLESMAAGRSLSLAGDGSTWSLNMREVWSTGIATQARAILFFLIFVLPNIVLVVRLPVTKGAGIRN